MKSSRIPEVETVDFQFAHGKTPKGDGLWAFAVRRNATLANAFTYSGLYGDAKKAAQKHYAGHVAIYVLS